MCVDWLPDLVCLEDHGGDWHSYLAAVYEHFRSDFVLSRPVFDEKPIFLKRHPELDGKEAAFWHVISEGKDESARTPDLRRCECVRWLRPMIEAVGTSRVRCWRNQRRANEKRVVIALGDFSFVVVLADRGDRFLLWTAYPVGYRNRREALRKEYEAYVSSQIG